MNQDVVNGSGRGRPRPRPHRVIADKGYSSRRIGRWLRQHNIRVTIPRTANERRRGPFDKVIYRLRARVEQLINRLKQFRRIATRYETRRELSRHGDHRSYSAVVMSLQMRPMITRATACRRACWHTSR